MLAWLAGALEPLVRGRLYSLTGGDERTRFFDLLLLEDLPFAGRRVSPHLLAAPGGALHAAARRALLARADAVVFVADGRRAALADDIEAYDELRAVAPDAPCVVASNLQDLPDAVSAAELRDALGLLDAPVFETAVPSGANVLECFRDAMRRMLERVGERSGLADPAAVAAFAARLKVAPRPGPRRTEGELRLVVSVPESGDEAADALAAQIRLARAHADAEAAVRLLEERNHELLALNRVARSILSAMEADNLLVVMLDATAEHLHATHASCVVFDPSEKGSLRTHVLGFGRDPALGFPREEANRFLGALQAADGPLPLAPDRNPEMHAALRLVDSRIQRAVYAPIKHGERLAGWLGIFALDDEPLLSSQGMLFLSSISRLAALGLDKIALLDKVRRLSARLEAEVKDRTAKLEVANAKIRALNRGLEARVAERTRALEEANRALKEARASALDSARLTGMGRLAAAFAHEVNNPVAGLKANLAFMREALDDLRARVAGSSKDAADGLAAIEEFRQAIEESAQGAERISGIIASLRRFSGDQAGGAVSVNAAVADAVTLLEERLHAAAELELRLGTVAELAGDASELNHLALALLTNAVEAIERTGRRGRIVVTTFQSGDRVTLSIRDSGCGIDPELLPRVFEPFVTTKANEPHAGLGLHGVYQAVKRRAGDVRLRSKPGDGTTVTVELPVGEPVRA